jgi:hypothetical protein
MCHCAQSGVPHLPYDFIIAFRSFEADLSASRSNHLSNDCALVSVIFRPPCSLHESVSVLSNATDSDPSSTLTRKLAGSGTPLALATAGTNFASPACTIHLALPHSSEPLTCRVKGTDNAAPGWSWRFHGWAKIGGEMLELLWYATFLVVLVFVVIFLNEAANKRLK